MIDSDNPHHDAVWLAVREHRLGLSGHAVFELLSVLTRLPHPHRLSGTDAACLIATNYPETRYLDSETSLGLPQEFAEQAILGGAVYDGLVAACARAHHLTLVTCDKRAQPTYDALGVSYRLIVETA